MGSLFCGGKRGSNVNENGQPFTNSEDFSFVLREVLGCYILMANGIAECGATALDNPLYDFNDNILMTGVKYWQTLTESQLSIPIGFQVTTRRPESEAP